jgi:hypothetical protein
VGENGFGPPGSIRGAFSVGDAGAGAGGVVVGAGVVVVVVVVVVVSGASSSSCAQDAVNAPIARRAASPATAERRRGKRLSEVIMVAHLWLAN